MLTQFLRLINLKKGWERGGAKFVDAFTAWVYRCKCWISIQRLDVRVRSDCFRCTISCDSFYVQSQSEHYKREGCLRVLAYLPLFQTALCIRNRQHYYSSNRDEKNEYDGTNIAKILMTPIIALHDLLASGRFVPASRVGRGQRA